MGVNIVASLLHAKLVGFERLQHAFQRAPHIVQPELEAWAETAGAHLSGEIAALTPKKEGTLQKSIGHEVEQAGRLGVAVTVGTPLNYALPVELGSKPHDITPKNGKALFFMMRGMPIFAKKVHHLGTTGFFMFEQGLEANISQLQDSFGKMIDRIFSKIARGNV